MNIAETISINPVDKTLGALNPAAAARFVREHTAPARTSSNKKGILDFCLASSAPGVSRFGRQMLLFRTMFATLLIISGSFLLSGELTFTSGLFSSSTLGIAEIMMGSMLVLGFLSRFAMIGSTLLFGILAGVSVANGVFDMAALLCCLGSMVFMTMGAGKFSADFLIKKAIINRAIARRRQQRADRLTYRAYRVHYFG